MHAGLNSEDLKGVSEFEFHYKHLEIEGQIGLENDQFIVRSEINKLPKQGHEALFRYLLSSPAAPYRIAVSGASISMSYLVHLRDFLVPEFRTLRVKEFAEFLDKAVNMSQFLAENFDCPYLKEQDSEKDEERDKQDESVDSLFSSLLQSLGGEPSRE